MSIKYPTSIRLTADDLTLLTTVREHMAGKLGMDLSVTDMMRLGLVAIARAEGIPLPQTTQR